MLISMTGYGRAHGARGEGGASLSWTWEVKSVNGRALDIRFRLPQGYEALEIPARAQVAAIIKRGSVNIALALRQDHAAAEYRLNEAVFERLLLMTRDLARRHDMPPPSIDRLLAFKGVLEAVEPESNQGDDEAGRQKALLSSLGEALSALQSSRAAEGQKIAEALTIHIQSVQALTSEADSLEALRPEAARARLAAQMAVILEGQSSVSPERLAQELAVLAVRGDVREELDRLKGHIQDAFDILRAGDPNGAGRRLDFLAQELNREANTLCSKASDAALTRVGLALKLQIDRFREQLQNLE